ncbi:hypothetical protein [Blackfly microvirus SF02]|uniref:Uncharacterized protein n=1 Tax=Blackfly microvirus SF02 TaxID=2576452 RepID=A0A4P8PJZ4_9VIRU|nr:hypothetical protein [Blackfly microvirus SF02]
MSILGELAGVGLSAAYNEISQQNAEQRAQRNYEKNAKMQFGFAQQAERNSAANQKFGLMAAGLSPALASEGRFSGVVGNSAPLQAAQGQKIDPLTLSELMNQKAQRELIDEERRGKEIDNDRKDDENATYDVNLRNWIDSQLKREDISDDYRSWLGAMRDNSQSYSKGTYDALSSYIELPAKIQQKVLEKADAEFKTEILDAKQKLQSYNWIAAMDYAQWERLVSDSAQIQMNTSLLAAKTGLTRHEANRLMAETKKLIEETKAISNNNVVELWTNQEWKKLMAYYGDKGITSAIDLIGVAGKAKVAGKALKNFKGSVEQGSKYSANNVLKSSPSLKMPQRSKRFSTPEHLRENSHTRYGEYIARSKARAKRFPK